MTELFQNVLGASFHGGIIIAVVLLARLALKKAPKKYICLLWLLAALRLLMPFEIESGFSLQPTLDAVTIPGSEYAQQITTGFDSGVGEIVLPSASEAVSLEKPEQDVTVDLGENTHVYEREVPLKVTILENYDLIVSWLWLAVAGGMLGYSVLSYLRLRRRVRDAVVLSEGVWVSGHVSSPFVMGFFRPRIYLNPGLGEGDRAYVLAHERCHIRRGDHWWKFLGFVTLAVHWFNPLVWLGYVLLCRDLEMACDEAVVKHMEVGERKAYSAALLACSAKGHTIAACPVAFGEVSVKERIGNVLNYRKPKFWVVLISVVAIAIVAVCFLTVPPEEPAPKSETAPSVVEGDSRWGVTANCSAPSATGIQFRFVQTDDSIPGELFYGQEYTLEKWDGSAWVALRPVIDNGTFTSEGILLQKNTTTVINIDWEWLYGEVPEGYYRLTKSVWLNTENQAFHVYFAIGEGYENWSGTEPSEEETEDTEAEEILSAVSGRVFTYEKGGFGGDFYIAIYPDQTFTYYEGNLSSYIGSGTWGLDGNTLVLVDSGLTYSVRSFRFRVKDGHLYFVGYQSDDFTYVDVADGDRFVVSGRAAAGEELVRDQAFYEELFTRQTDGAYTTMWISDLFEAFYAEPEEFARQIARKFGEAPGTVRQMLTCMSYEVEWYEPERYLQTLEMLRNVAELDQTAVDLLYWYYWEGEYRALGGGSGVTVTDSGQDYLAAALEGCEILEGYHLQVSSGSMFRYTYVACRVEAAEDVTSIQREYGYIDENTYAFSLVVTFVPGNEQAYAYSMAGNTGEYEGTDPDVPEGALAYSRCGYVTWREDGWHIEIVGTGW